MGQAPADIHREIAITREQMSATIKAIAERLEPKELMNAALSRPRRLGQDLLDLARELAQGVVEQRKRQANGRGAWT